MLLLLTSKLVSTATTTIFAIPFGPPPHTSSSSSSSSAHCLSKLNLLLMLSNNFEDESCTSTAGVSENNQSSSSMLLSWFSVLDVYDDVRVARSFDDTCDDSRFRSMFCSSAFSLLSSAFSSLERSVGVSSSQVPFSVAVKPCLFVVGGGRKKQQNIVGIRCGRRRGSSVSRVNVANLFLLSFSLVLISLSEWLVLHCYHRKEFRRKGC